MKTKLLKKIRKRYSIERIDSISRDNQMWKDTYSHLKLPFYYFVDNYNDWHNAGFKTYEKAYSNLVDRINIDYSKYAKRNNNKSEKIWWINKTK